MEISGRVQNGAIVLDEGYTLPEGIDVRVIYLGQPTIHVAPNRKTIRFPLVKGGQPGTLNLTRDRIAEILMEEEIEALKEQWNAPS